MLVDEFAFLGVIVNRIEKPIAFVLRHVEDFHRHQPVDVNGLSAGVLMGAEHRMHLLGERLRAAAVATDGRAIIVVVQCFLALEPAADRRIERFISGITAGKQRIAAARRDLDRIEQRRLARDFGVDHVVMEHHLAVRQRPDWLAILADVRNHHDAGQQ